ncbi:hypothetical protein LINGRAHAP2_LOCUS20002 [Linum grandiflorum]
MIPRYHRAAQRTLSTTRFIKISNEIFILHHDKYM